MKCLSDPYFLLRFKFRRAGGVGGLPGGGDRVPQPAGNAGSERSN